MNAIRESQWQFEITICSGEDWTDTVLFLVFIYAKSIEKFPPCIFKVAKKNRVIDVLKGIHVAPDHILNKNDRIVFF